MQLVNKKYEELLAENEELRAQLEEAKDTVEAIRTGQVDAIVVENGKGHQLYTLETADQTYRLFIEKMTEGAVTLNRQGIILYCNSQFATLTGQILSKVIGTPFSDFVSPSCRQDYERLFGGAWEEDTRGEVALDNALGTAVQLALNCLNLEDGNFLSVIVTDLTTAKENQRLLKNKNEELENINKELEQSNNDLLQFASVASHDLQEPLRKIQVFSNLLISQNRNNLNEKSITFLTKILESSDRMKQLINDILNYSRLSATDGMVADIDLNLMFDGLRSDYEVMIEELGAEIKIESLPCIRVNPGQIRQVFQNLVSNALKFTKKGEKPVITIKSARIGALDPSAREDPDGKYCRISVRDNGIGFDEKYLENIFSLFERLNAKADYEGSGIGLAIARKIIEKHNGMLTAHSSEGNGAEFIIILPID